MESEVSKGNKKVSKLQAKGTTPCSVDSKYCLQKRVYIMLIDIGGTDFDALNSIDSDTLDPSKFLKYMILESFPLLIEALSTRIKIDNKERIQISNGFAVFDNIMRAGNCLV